VKRAWRAAAVSAIAAVAGAVACSDINNHLLEGQQYIASGACLTPQSVIDDLPGSDPGDDCPPECVTAPMQGGGTAVFITTTCPPYPGYSVELPDAGHGAGDPCVGAFAAYEAGTICSSLDGGLEAASEAGADAGAHPEAAVDAGVEAAVEASADAGGGG
jgi:hypothetical protein